MWIEHQAVYKNDPINQWIKYIISDDKESLGFNGYIDCIKILIEDLNRFKIILSSYKDSVDKKNI